MFYFNNLMTLLLKLLDNILDSSKDKYMYCKHHSLTKLYGLMLTIRLNKD